MTHGCAKNSFPLACPTTYYSYAVGGCTKVLEVGDLIHYDHLTDPLQLCPCELCGKNSSAIGVVTEVWKLEDGTVFVDAAFDFGVWTFRLDVHLMLASRGLTVLGSAPSPKPCRPTFW